MKLPWVSRRAYEFVVETLKRSDTEHVEERDRLRLELEREREANRNLMGAALALRNLGNPYRPANMTEPPKPVGKARAEARLRELEDLDRQKAKELADAARATEQPAVN